MRRSSQRVKRATHPSSVSALVSLLPIAAPARVSVRDKTCRRYHSLMLDVDAVPPDWTPVAVWVMVRWPR